MMLGPVTDKNFAAATTVTAAAWPSYTVPQDVIKAISNGKLGIFTQYHPLCCFSRLAYISEVPVGALLATVEKVEKKAASKKPDTHYVKVHSIAVLPAFQRQGVGSKLLNELIREVTEMNLAHAGSDDVPECLKATKISSLTSSSEIHKYELRKNLKNSKKLPLVKIVIESATPELTQMISSHSSNWERSDDNVFVLASDLS